MDNIPTREMVRCQVTGRIVPASECEYVVIKILKHKDADLNGFNPFNGATTETKGEVLATVITAPSKPSTALETEVPEGAVLLTQEEFTNVKPKSIIPNQYLAFMKQPGEPGAAEEIRRV